MNPLTGLDGAGRLSHLRKSILRGGYFVTTFVNENDLLLNRQAFYEAIGLCDRFG